MWSEKQKNGTYKFREWYTDPLTGKQKKVSVTMEKDNARMRKLAEQTLSEKIEKLIRQTCVPSINQKMTFGELVSAYLDYQKSVVKLSTYARNETVAKTLKRVLGENTLLSALSAGYIRKQFTLQNRAVSTLNEWDTRLKAILRWGYENDYIDDIRFLDKLKKQEDKQKKIKLEGKFLESWELRAILNGMDIEQWKLMTEFLALSGLRIGEAIALEFNDIDFQKKNIRVDETRDANNHVTTDTKTGTSMRDVFMQPELETVCKAIRSYTLKQRLKYHFQKRLFFCDINGDYLKYNSYRKYLGDISKRTLGRRITPHTLRHTHTSLMAAAGVDLETISRRLGHADSQITRYIYMHVTDALKERDREQIQGVRIL